MDNSERMSVEPEEWEEAEKFFKENPQEIKFRKSKTMRGKKEGHSFVKINDIIYALNNTQRVSYDMNFKEKSAPEKDIGAGGFGRIKFAINKEDELIAIKVSGAKGELKKETKKVLQEKRHILGQEKRPVKKSEKESGKIKVKDKEINTNAKIYTAMPYLNSGNLTAKLPKGANPIVLGLYAMMKIQALHNERYLHRDIKLENFMLNQADGHLVVLPVDFDFLIQLPAGKTSMTEGNFFAQRIIGTEGYMAPEVDKKGEYSIASDVYSLGKMLEYIHFPENIYAPMTQADPKKRGSLSDAMAKVVVHLKEQPTRSNSVKASIEKVIADYEIFSKENAKQAAPLNLPIFPSASTMNFSSSKKDKFPSNTKGISALVEELERFHKEMIDTHDTSAAIGALALSIELLKNEKFESSASLLIQQLLGNLGSIYKGSQNPSEKKAIDTLKKEIITKMQAIDPKFEAPLSPKNRSKPFTKGT